MRTTDVSDAGDDEMGTGRRCLKGRVVILDSLIQNFEWGSEWSGQKQASSVKVRTYPSRQSIADLDE